MPRHRLKIALFGASGTIGQRILNEALIRGHKVSVVPRNSSPIDQVPVVRGDALDASSIAEAVKGNDVVISAVGPRPGEGPKIVPQAAAALIASKGGRRARGADRGGAGSLEVEPRVQLLDTPQFPREWKGIAVTHRDALNIIGVRYRLDLLQPGHLH